MDRRGVLGNTQCEKKMRAREAGESIKPGVELRYFIPEWLHEL
jgi:hypothetical protein